MSSPAPVRNPRAPRNPAVSVLRGRLGALARCNPDGQHDAEVAALRAEIATLALIDRVTETLAEHRLSGAQRHRVASLLLSGADR